MHPPITSTPNAAGDLPVTLNAASELPVTYSAAGNGGLQSAWESFIGLFPSGLVTVLGIVGIAIVLIVVVPWLWTSRHGGSEKKLMKTVPWVGIGIGMAFAAPKWIIPVVVFVLEAVGNVVIPIFQSLFGMLGR